MVSRNDYRDPLANLGQLVRALAHDAAEALDRPDRGEMRLLGSIIGRIDDLRSHLRDRTSTEIYGWLLSLRRVLDQEIESQLAHHPLEEDEGSGYFGPSVATRSG